MGPTNIEIQYRCIMYGDRLELSLEHGTQKRPNKYRCIMYGDRLELTLGHGTCKRQILVQVYNVWGQARINIGA